MSKDPLHSLRKVNAIWHQKAWGHPDHAFTEKPRTLAVTLAMEPCINGLGLSASSNVPAHNWKKRGRNYLSTRFPCQLSLRPWSLFWLSPDYMSQLHCYTCGKAVMDNSLRDWKSFWLKNTTAHTGPWVSMVLILALIKGYLVLAADQTASSKLSSQLSSQDCTRPKSLFSQSLALIRLSPYKHTSCYLQ